MIKTGKISPFQLYALMFLSRAVALFTFILPEISDMPASDRAFAALILMLFEIIYAIFAFRILDRCCGRGLIEYLRSEHPGRAAAAAVIYILSFIWFAGLGISRFELFMSTAMFPDSDLRAAAVILAAAALAAVYKGFEATGRSAGVIFIFLSVSIVIILASVSGDFEYINLKPVFYTGLMNNMRYAFFMSLRYAEIPALYCIAPYVSGNIKKSVYSLIISYGVLSFTVLMILCGVTGEYGSRQMFQLYTLTIIAKIGLFERMDDILMSMWVLCAFIKTAFFLSAADCAAKQGFGKNFRYLPFVFASGIVAVYLITSKTMLSFAKFAGSALHSLLFIGIMFIFPFIFTAGTWRKKGNL